jgi:hypothetical protein
LPSWRQCFGSIAKRLVTTPVRFQALGLCRPDSGNVPAQPTDLKLALKSLPIICLTTAFLSWRLFKFRCADPAKRAETNYRVCGVVNEGMQ